MSRRGENIYKRSDGRWEGRYQLGRNEETDKVRYGYVYAYSYNECRQLKARAEQVQKQPTSGKLTVSACLDLWIRERRMESQLHVGTIQLYARQIESHIKPLLGNYKLNRLTGEMLNHFKFNQLRKGRLDGKGGLSSSVVNTQMVIIKSMLAFAIRKKYLSSFPEFEERHVRQTPERETHVLDREEQKRLETAIFRGLQEQNNKKIGLYMGVLIALYTGLRIGELGGLQWKDVNLFTGMVTVKNTLQRVKTEDGEKAKTKVVVGPAKTGKSVRSNPIGQAMTETLRIYYTKLPPSNRNSSNFVFTYRGKPIEPRMYQSFFKRLLEECQITNTNFHALRHTFATRCLERGMDFQSLCEMMGHSNATITAKRYAHSLIAHKIECMEKLTFLSSEWGQLA